MVILQPMRPEHMPRSEPHDDVGAFVVRHQTGLWRFLRACGCGGQQAEEIAQDALLVALRKGLAGGGADDAAGAFLRETAKHLWLRTQRDDRRRAEIGRASCRERVFRVV